MNKLILGLLCVVSFTLNVTAQVEPEKAFKKAKKAYSSYNLDPANNAASLPEAYEMISVAVTDEEVAAQFNTWQLKAQICNSIVTTESNEVLNGTKKEMAVGTVEKAMEAYDATEMAVKTALKKFQKTATKTLWRETGTTMSNMYVFYVQQDMYAEAFPYANNLISVHDKLAEMDEIYFEDELALQDQMYAAAFCGNRAGSADAKGLYKRLIDLGSEKAAVYSDYFSILVAEGDEEAALAVLDDAKKKFPEKQEILYAEINYFLQNDRYEELVDKLKEAISREPNNKTLYSTLGSVYEQIYNAKVTEAGEENEETIMLFDSAKEYYAGAIEKDATFTDAIYALGALYYNKAAALNEKMRNLGTSKEENMLYDKYKAEMDQLFDTSLPYFQDVEKIDPNDRNSLIALKEIYAKSGDLNMSKEFKTRLETIDAGGKNESSYFNN